MTSSNLRTKLSLIEAQLFASTELAVITAIDASEDAAEAIVRLQRLGMTSDEAATVLNMPLRARTQSEREHLFREAEVLRAELDQRPD